MNRRTARITLAALLGLVLLGAVACSPGGDGSSTGSGTDGGLGISAPSLDEFLDADSKTGDYETHTEWASGDTLDMHGQFWVDGRLFRYDIYDETDTLLRSVISPDGETAYFVFHDDQVCEPSVASVDYYLMRYAMPEGEGVEDGTDEGTGATRVKYVVKKTDDMAGAANPWYSEDVTYLVKDDAVVGVITRGAVPKDDGSVGELDVNRELWSNVKAGVTIPADTFELPYPVQDAE